MCHLQVHFSSSYLLVFFCPAAPPWRCAPSDEQMLLLQCEEGISEKVPWHPALSQQPQVWAPLRALQLPKAFVFQQSFSKEKTSTKYLMFAMTYNTSFPNLHSISASSLQYFYHPPAQANPEIPAPLEWETEWEVEGNCFKECSKSIKSPELEGIKTTKLQKTCFSIFQKD